MLLTVTNTAERFEVIEYVRIGWIIVICHVLAKMAEILYGIPIPL